MPRSTVLALTAATLALGLAACGSSSSSSRSGGAGAGPASTGQTSTGASAGTTTGSSQGGGAGAAISDAADPSGSLSFTQTSLHAKAGAVTIDFANKSPIGHNFTVADSSGKVLGATPTFNGGSKTLSVKLTPGTYTFYCSVAGHRMAGMQGTLKVT